MSQLDWGRDLYFKNKEEYYETLGFLTKTSRPIDVYTHDNGNGGVWGGKGKLETRVGTHILPRPLRAAFESVKDVRFNVTDYVFNLRNHGFIIKQDFTGYRYTYHLFPESVDTVIKSIESDVYVEDFFRGYNW